MLLVVLATLCFLACTALARYDVDISDNTGSRKFRFSVADNADRACWCIINTQTSIIQGVGGGDIKVFRSLDCTGNYNVTTANGSILNAQYVNSFSMGALGVDSSDPEGHCPNWYAR